MLENGVIIRCLKMAEREAVQVVCEMIRIHLIDLKKKKTIVGFMNGLRDGTQWELPVPYAENHL